MAIAPVTNGKLTTLATASATSVTATFPASHTATAGNLLLAIHFVRDTGALTDPSGWTLIGTTTNNSQHRLSAWIKSAAGGETGLVGPTTANVRQCMGIWEFSSADVDVATLIAAATTAFTHQFMGSGASTLTTQASTAIDPTATGDVYFIHFSGFHGTTGNAGTPSTPFTKDLQDGINSGMASFQQTTNPGSTTNTHTWTTAVTTLALVLAVPQGSAAAVGQPTLRRYSHIPHGALGNTGLRRRY